MATGLVIFVGVILGAAAAFWVVRRESTRGIGDQIQAALRASHADFLALASQQLATERAKQVGDLEARKGEIKQAIQGLEQQLAKYQQLMKEFEHDRARKYGSLEQQLTATTAETQRLHQTTAQLTSMLGNAKIRGQWGEKTAEDILRLCGLQPEVHYQKQRTTQLGRPDFTFLLPHDQKLYMDVKFPLDNYIKLVNAGREEERQAYREQFLRDVRAHLKELERRDYAPVSQESPDYVVMFIPNEQVFGLVNEWMHDLIDEALKRRIIICGPSTLYAHIRLIAQMWETYHQARAVGDIAKTVNEFLKAYERFKERFGELGHQLEEAKNKYEEIVRTSYAQLDRKIERIEDYRRGQGLESGGGTDTEEPPVELFPTKRIQP